MSTDHDSYEQIVRRRRGSAEFREGYEEARRAILIGQAVRDAASRWACPRPRSPPGPA